MILGYDFTNNTNENTNKSSQQEQKAVSYLFDLEDVDAWKTHLKGEGYVVLRHVVSQENVDITMNLLLDDLYACSIFGNRHGKNDEGVETKIIRQQQKKKKKKKNGAAPPNNNNDDKKPTLSLPRHGILACLAQTRAPWFLRGQERIHQVFSAIWNTTDLITSMDSVIVWTFEQSVKNSGLHLDQNPATKPQLDCYQGMVPLLPVTSPVGGLGVVPASHSLQARQCLCQDDELFLQHQGDRVVLKDDSHHCNGAILLECDAGDLILWDSRTIHGGIVGSVAASGCPRSSKANNDKNGPRIIRAAVPIAMTPRSWASPQIQALRLEGFQEGRSFNHCPHEAGTSTGTLKGRKPNECAAVILTEQQRAVL